ncbi:MAG: TraM recognition domain-containing protein, partial [Propionicimonas sp.]
NYEDVSKLAANLIIQDLKTLSSELRKDPGAHKVNVIIDEFSATGSDNVLGLLARARDAKMPVTLATQALADLRRDNPAFLEQVLGIVNCFTIHRANTENDAEIFAGLTGKEKKFKIRMGVEQSSGMPGSVGSGAATGQGHVEEVDEYRVMPHEIQQLKQGQMVYIANAPDNRFMKVSVILESGEAVALARLKNTPPVAALVAEVSSARSQDDGEGTFAGAAAIPFDAWSDEPSEQETAAAGVAPTWDGSAQPAATAGPWGGKGRGKTKSAGAVVVETSRATIPSAPSYSATEEAFERRSPVTVFETAPAKELPDGTGVTVLPGIPAASPLVVTAPSAPLLDLGALRTRTPLAPVISTAGPVAGSPFKVSAPEPEHGWDEAPAVLKAPWLTSGTDELGRTYGPQASVPAEMVGPEPSGEGSNVPSTKPTVSEHQPRSVFLPVTVDDDNWS